MESVSVWARNLSIGLVLTEDRPWLAVVGLAKRVVVLIFIFCMCVRGRNLLCFPEKSTIEQLESQ